MPEYLETFNWFHTKENIQREWHIWVECDEKAEVTALFIGISINIICAFSVDLKSPQNKLEEHAITIARLRVKELLAGDPSEVIDLHDTTDNIGK